VLEEPFIAAVDSPVQWVFDRSRQAAPEPGAAGPRRGEYVAVSLSAADDLVDVPVGVLRERYLPHLERLLPRAVGAEVEDFFVTRERHATFRSAPGVARFRPRPGATGRPGLHLAGAWTGTGWPATMEGAVRSGEAAAASVLAAGAPDHAAGRDRPDRPLLPCEPDGDHSSPGRAPAPDPDREVAS
jgi:hypothetical protein